MAIENHITFSLEESGDYFIMSKTMGSLGYIKYIEKYNIFVFVPVEDKYYRASYLAVILKYLNSLNGYDKNDAEISKWFKYNR